MVSEIGGVQLPMGLLINVALLLLSFLGTLAAFGGETWKRGEEPLHQRVTRRGWVSIALLCLALALGIFKEFRNSSATRGLNVQIEALEGQLKEAHALVKSQRLGELADKVQRISEYEGKLSAAQAAFERYRSVSLAIKGRSARANLPPPPVLHFSFASRDFRLEVCSAAFAAASGRAFVEADCLASNFAGLLREMSDVSFEQGVLGPSAIATLLYAADISIAHRNALNGPFSPGSTAPQVTLESLLAQTPKECGTVPVKVASIAAVLRVVETSGQRLHWLFTYRLPAAPGSEEAAKHDLLSASGVFAFQMGRLDQVMHDRSQPNDATFLLGNFLDNFASGYRQLANGLADVLKTCGERKEQLVAEMREIEKAKPAKR